MLGGEREKRRGYVIFPIPSVGSLISILILVCLKGREKRCFFYLHVELVDDSRLDVRNRIGLRVVGEGHYDPRLCNEG